MAHVRHPLEGGLVKTILEKQLASNVKFLPLVREAIGWKVGLLNPSLKMVSSFAQLLIAILMEGGL